MSDVDQLVTAAQGLDAEGKQKLLKALQPEAKTGGKSFISTIFSQSTIYHD